MTLLSICQDVADEVGLERPTTIISNNNDTARRLLQAAQRTGKTLAKSVDWKILEREHSFNTASATSSYDLPSDFDRVLPYTQWDRANEWRLLGPLSPQDWQYVKSGVIEEGPRRRYRFKPSSGTMKFFVSPTPSSADELVFEYISTQWCESSGGTGKDEFSADTDVVRLDAEIFRMGVNWRIRRSIGLTYLTEFDEYQHMLRVRKASEGDMPRLRMDRHFYEDQRLYANIQDANFPSS